MSGEADPEGPVKIVYIGGYGRSGSSLLDSLLAHRGNAVSGGELTSLFDWYDRGRPCTCGVAVNECPLWGAVVPAVETRLSLSAAHMHAVSRRSEFEGKRSDEWCRIWNAVYSELATTHGVRRIVDSSKSARGNSRHRLSRDLSEAEVSAYVHLYRELAGVVHSRRRGNNVDLEDGGSPGSMFASSLKAIVGWLRANRAASREVADYKPSISVSYRRLCLNADAVVERILRTASWGGAADVVTSPAMTQQHSVAGNRMFRSGWNGVIALDTSWTEELPLRWRLVSVVAHRLARLGRIVP